MNPRQSDTTWTCFGCAHQHADGDDMPQWCPKCGGVWIRATGLRAHRPSWLARVVSRILTVGLRDPLRRYR